MRRGLKQERGDVLVTVGVIAARAAPYEKGTETTDWPSAPGKSACAARAAPYEKGTETAQLLGPEVFAMGCRARGPL